MNGIKYKEYFNALYILNFIKNASWQSSDIQTKHFKKYEELLQECDSN